MSEMTREALAVARDLMVLPGNERQLFAKAIKARAADWHKAGVNPPVWPMVLRIEQDPRVVAEKY